MKAHKLTTPMPLLSIALSGLGDAMSPVDRETHGPGICGYCGERNDALKTEPKSQRSYCRKCAPGRETDADWPSAPAAPCPPLVVHCKQAKFDVYIGRPSKWGNPFEIGKDGDRETVIRKYREWVVAQPHLMAALPELRGKVLGCWCAPKACHGDVLSSLASVPALPTASAKL